MSPYSYIRRSKIPGGIGRYRGHCVGGCVIRGGGPLFTVDVGGPPPPPVYVAPPPPPPAPVATNDDLQRLVAPIALYPDPLLAEVLAASTFPDQIQAAAQWLQSDPSPSDADIAAQPWDPSVQALAHYPTVLTYMSSEIGWTQSLGSAFATQQPEVMGAVQDLRAQAYADGSLHDTPEQRVVVEGDPVIYILPVDPGMIYVPVYDPVLVYGGNYAITFGPSFVIGPWFVHGFDWYGHVVFVGDWRGGWMHGPYGWRRDPGWGPGRYHTWVRDDRRWGPVRPVNRYVFRHEIARGPWHAAPVRDLQHVRDDRRGGKFGGPIAPKPGPVNRGPGNNRPGGGAPGNNGPGGRGPGNNGPGANPQHQPGPRA